MSVDWIIELNHSDEEMIVETSLYVKNNTLALVINTEFGEPYCMVSSNILDSLAKQHQGNHIWINTNWKEKYIPVPELIEAGIITKSDRQVQSGWAFYDLYKVNLPEESDGNKSNFTPIIKF